MTETIDLNKFSEEDPSSSAARLLARIHAARDAGVELANCSATEGIMVAIALCDRTYLPKDLSAAGSGLLWFRLDDAQRQAIHLFGQEMSHGGEGPQFEIAPRRSDK